MVSYGAESLEALCITTGGFFQFSFLLEVLCVVVGRVFVVMFLELE